MILTTNEALTLLQLDNNYYNVVEALIPSVQNFIIDYTKNHFEHLDIYLNASTISFSNESPALILDSASGFIDAEFSEELHVRVRNSKLNDNIYQIDNVESGIITLIEGDKVLDEVEGNFILITAVVFPQALKLAAAKLIGYDLQKANMNGISSRSLGDYSESYVSNGDYPQALLKLLAPYKRL